MNGLAFRAIAVQHYFSGTTNNVASLNCEEEMARALMAVSARGFSIASLVPAFVRSAFEGRSNRANLHTALARLAETSPHLLDDIGAEVISEFAAHDQIGRWSAFREMMARRNAAFAKARAEARARREEARARRIIAAGRYDGYSAHLLNDVGLLEAGSIVFEAPVRVAAAAMPVARLVLKSKPKSEAQLAGYGAMSGGAAAA